VVGSLVGLGLGTKEGFWEGREVVGSSLGAGVGNVEGIGLGAEEGI